VGPALPDRVRSRALIDPADRSTLRALRSRHALTASRSRGQHFLVSPAVLDAVVAAAELTPADRVVEIGPGLGALTIRLARAAGSAVAYEVDARLAAILREEVLAATENVEVVTADVLQVDMLASRPTRVVANLPYRITTPVLERLLGDERRPPVAVLMVQQEVAERMSGASRSWLSVFVESFATIDVVRRVSPGAFDPRPRVASAVVRLRARERPLFAPHPAEAFLALVSDAFRHRRKTLVAALGFEAALDRDHATAALADAGIARGARPERLAAVDWVRLYDALAARGLRRR
jgi:16S rRNA (adenine1518-N6/adenine1519-N6)-dimethyltransferase